MTAKTDVRKTTLSTLSEYSNSQLIAKLDGNKLLGLSREVAIEILEKRGQDADKYKGGAWVDTTKVNKPAKAVSDKEEAGESKEKIKKAVVKAEKPGRRPSIILIDETLVEVKAIISDEKTSKSDKVKSLLKLNYTPGQISKTSIGVTPQVCHSLRTKLGLK